MPLAPIQRASLPAAAPLGAVEDAARPPLVAAPLPDLVQPVAPEMEPVMVEPVATAPAVIAPPDRHGPVPIGKGDASIAAKPAAPHKPVIASAPTPVVFATAAQSAPATPEATKDAATPVDQASPEDAAPADPERNDPATVALPTMAPVPVPVLAQVVTPPPSGSDGPAKSASTEGQAPAHGAPAVTAAVPGAAPPVAPTPPGKADVAASPDRPAVVTATGLRPVREETTSADPKPATASAPDPRRFAALVEPKPVAPAPAAPTAPSPVPEAHVMAEPGRMGHEMAVAIARHTAEGGGEALTVRLNPAEFGRIDVTLSFDDRGTLRAVLAAETPAALDVLRRDSADLGRALSDAGMRTDAQSFRFDTRQGGADAGGQGAHGQQRWQPAATPRTLATATA
ncbi:MAG: flagellar hook-length control protein FliK, partial [Sphingomonas sp.]